MHSTRSRLLALLLLSLLTIAPLAAAYTPSQDANGRETEPNPRMVGNVTVATRKPAVCGTDPLCYEDDSAIKRSLATHGFTLNPDVPEPITFFPNRLDCQYYGEDATSPATTSAWCANVSVTKNWLDTTAWSTSGAEGNETFTRTMRNGAHALRIVNPGNVPGTFERDTYVLDFADILTDAAKHRLILGIETVSYGRASGNAVDFLVYDANLTGYSYFSVALGGKADGSTSILANNSGAIVFWDELVTEALASPNDGPMSGDIGKLELWVNSDSAVGPTEIYVYALGIQVKRWEFGVGSDGLPVHNMTYADCEGKARSAPLGYACLSTFNPNFGYQNARDLKVAYQVKASNLPESKTAVMDKAVDEGDYSFMANYRFQFHLPTQLDLTYAGDEVVTYTLPVSGKQHTVARANGLDKLSTLTSAASGTQHTLLSSPPLGKDVEVEFTVYYTEAQDVNIAGAGALGLPPEHWLSKTWVWLSGLAVVGVFFARGLRKRRKGSK